MTTGKHRREFFLFSQLPRSHHLIQCMDRALSITGFSRDVRVCVINELLRAARVCVCVRTAPREIPNYNVTVLSYCVNESASLCVR